MIIKDSKGNTILELEDDRDYGRDLSDLVLRNADFEGMTLEGWWFFDSDMVGANMKQADLYWANFVGAKLKNADFRFAILNGALLDYADLRNADLRNTDLSYDKLGTAASIKGANLADIIFNEGTNFQGVRYDDSTIFPKGFVPEKFGLIQER